jgi:pimeloyl-ACP methyl ester carboxylesterase
MKRTLATCFFAGLFAVPAVAGDLPKGGAETVTVREMRLPVTLSDGNTYGVASAAYFRGGTRGKLLEIAIHGITYDHRYWDAPSIHGVDYSYAHFMAEQGHVVLAIDQLGAGRSDRPNGDFLNLKESASVVKSLVARFRTRQNPLGVAFDKIVLVGHSFGSLTAIRAQAECGCADGVVVTGWLNDTPPPIDPAIFGPLLAEPYVIVPTALREGLFYFAETADPDMIAFDNQRMRTSLSRGQLIDLIGALTSNPTSAVYAAPIEVPVLIQIGQADTLMSANTVSEEDTLYGQSPAVTTQELPNLGHSMNLHRNHLEGWTYIESWLGLNFH